MTSEQSSKIVFAIISNEYDAFNCKLEQKWRERMIHYKGLFNNISYYFLKCKPFRSEENQDAMSNGYYIQDDNFYVDGQESIVGGIGKKTMKFFEVMHSSYDYIVRPNISSVLLVDRLLTFLQKSPKTLLYSGNPEPYGHAQPKWAFGACYIVSNDVAKMIADNKDHIVTFADQTGSIEQVYDDVWVGFTVLQHLKIKLTPFKCIQILHPHDILQSLNNIVHDPLLFHIRIKMIGQRDPIEVELQQYLNHYIMKQCTTNSA